ncbi:MAG: orotidine-5'-phosphate decarboxylase [Spirochaetaceae bacterium]|nr:orotidine-5'-phosphate decarboxylase [Spirochaetaceae bacterium]|tara:strand:+ start:19162 stop:19971 length:810 start_codon:yes stop_codon:yes gene_type:complete
MSTFYTRYRERREAIKSVLCVGLDPDPARLPDGYESGAQGAGDHLRDVVDATHDLAVAYKPNAAFFESMGSAGWELLKDVIQYIRKRAPGALIVLDAKRGDLGNTASHYAAAIFDDLEADSVTLNPYMGKESLIPFLERKDRASFILCLTSNSGARDLQYHGDPPLYQHVARLCRQWHDEFKNLGLVVGATRDPEELSRVRELAPGMIFLVPGVGSQGGDLNEVLRKAGDDVLINSSRSILFASHNRAELPEKCRAEASSLVEKMRPYL